MSLRCWQMMTVVLVLGWTSWLNGASAQEKSDPKPQKRIPLMPGKDVLKGRVTLEGDMPDLAKMDAELKEMIQNKAVHDAPHCLCEKAGADRLQQAWRINKQNKGVANVLVFLVPEQGTFFAFDPDDDAVIAVKDKALELRQPYGAFRPHVAVLFAEYKDKANKKVKTGQKVVAYNDTDKAEGGKKGGITHNIKWPGGNIVLAPGNSREITDLEINIKAPTTFQCSIHPWMSAYIWVLNHPYYAITDANGKFEIKNAPEGKVKIVVWHEAAAGNFLNKDASNGEIIELKKGDTIKNFTLKAE